MKSITHLEYFICGLINQRGFKKKLDVFRSLTEDRGRCGFEKWLQFEMLIYAKLLFKEANDEVVFETIYSCLGAKNECRVDLVCRHNKSRITIELKTRMRPNNAVKAIIADLKKLGGVAPQNEPTSHFAVALFFNELSEKQINNIKAHCKELKIISVKNNHTCFYIAESK